MDTSKEYAKMSDCKEIQGEGEFEPGDWVFYLDGAIVADAFVLDSCTLREKPKGELGGLGGDCLLSWEMHQEVMEGTEEYRKKGKFPILVGTYIWLPRQDQIQEMIGGFQECLEIIVNLYGDNEFFSYLGLPGVTPFVARLELGARFKSMEELWLSIYMHGKHKKIWDGSKWVKVEG